jgi:ribosomal protein L21
MSDLDHLVLFMDKNHPPKILKGQLEYIDKLKTKYEETIEIQKVLMVPNCIQPHILNDIKYPFSLQLLVKCIIRALCRYDHLTLSAE